MAQWVRPDINIDFIGRRRAFFTLSALAVGASIVAMIFNVFVRGSALNYGTDFRGGSQIQIEFSRAVKPEEVRSALKAANYHGAEVVRMEGGRANFFMLRLTEVSSFSKADQAKAKQAVEAFLPGQLKRLDYKEGGDKVYLIFKNTLKIDIAAEQARKAEARAEAEARDKQKAAFEDAKDAKTKKPGAKQDGAKKDGAKKDAAKKDAKPVPAGAASQPASQPAASLPGASQPAASQPASGGAASQPASAAASQPATKTAASLPTKPSGPAVSLQLLEALKKAKLEIQQVQLFGRAEDRTFEVTLGGLGSDIEQAFEKALGKGVIKDIPQTESVGAKMGKQLRDDGIKSVLYALLLMLVYIAFRFDFRYAPGAVIALAHDVIITIGLFALTWTEFSLPVVAALLTIAGYSINDTIVVYDRIRENVARLRDRKFPLVVNSSINETLSRTLLTSLTTLFTCIAIWVLGTGVLRTFAFALTAGILIGTYSSIFVASPLVVLLNERLAAAKRKAGAR